MTTPRIPRLLTPEQITEAHTLHYKQGYSLSHVADKYGVPINTVVNYFKRMGLPMLKHREFSPVRSAAVDWTPIANISAVRRLRGYAAVTKEEAERIRQFILSDERITCTMVAKRLGISIQSVCAMYNRNYSGNRPALPTAEGKAEYQRRKSQRKGARYYDWKR